MDESGLKRLANSLPRHPGILDKDRYLNAAVLIPLVKTDAEFSFLFQKRAAGIRQGGEISFPGGHLNRGRILTAGKRPSGRPWKNSESRGKK